MGTGAGASATPPPLDPAAVDDTEQWRQRGREEPLASCGSGLFVDGLVRLLFLLFI